MCVSIEFLQGHVSVAALRRHSVIVQRRKQINSFLQAWCLSLFLFSRLFAPSVSLSFTHSLSLLASTDRFHNHFSEVTALSAAVTQPLACSVSFTCAHTVHAHTTKVILHCSTLHYTHKKKHLKECVALSWQPHHAMDSTFKRSTCLPLARCAQSVLLLLKTHVQPVVADCKCNTDQDLQIIFNFENFIIFFWSANVNVTELQCSGDILLQGIKTMFSWGWLVLTKPLLLAILQKCVSVPQQCTQ